MEADEASPLLQPIQTQISPHAPHRTVSGSRRRFHSFAVGSVVEVQTNEEDFKGVYFSAKVIEPRTSGKKRGRKKSRKLYVEYHNLLAHEDGSDRLREYVDTALVRPAPPEQETVKGFELNDIVDAFYKDGWWTGVVNRAVSGGERFVVTFHNPPDELEFGLAELRPHLDWVNGNWLRSQRQSISGLMFDVGRKVEVSFDREDFQDAWFPGTIREDLENEAFLVDLNRANTDNRCSAKARVDLLHIRPCPLLLKDKKFVLWEKVDAFFDFGWWSGIITKELENSRYIVLLQKKKCKKIFRQLELRPHVEWKDGKWSTYSHELSVPSLDDGVCQHHTPEKSSASVPTAPVSLNEVETCFAKTQSSVVSPNGQSEQLIPNNQKLSHVTTLLPKKRAYFLGSEGSFSQSLKKPRERDLLGENIKDGHDRQSKEFLCDLQSPESSNIMENCVGQTTLDQFSSNHSGEENVIKQRNSSTTQNASTNNKSTLSSLGKSGAQILPLESIELKTGEKEPVTPRNTEDVQNEPGKIETELVVTDLQSSKTGSSGLSGGNRSQHSSKIGVDDQRQHVHDFTSQKIKDGKQSGIAHVSEKKRGRPKRILVVSTEALARATGDLNQEDGDLQRPHEVVVAGIEASKSAQEKMRQDQETVTQKQEKVIYNHEKVIQNKVKATPNQDKSTPNLDKETRNLDKVTRNKEKVFCNQEKGTTIQDKATPNQENQDKTNRNKEKATPNQEKATLNKKKVIPNQENQEKMTLNQGKAMLSQERIASNQSDPRKRKVRMTKRILASKHEESGLEESVRLVDDHSLKQIKCDLVGTSGGKATGANHEMDVEVVIEPSNDFDNQPLSKWIEEIHMSSVIDGSADSEAQCIVNGDTHGDHVVLYEDNEKQPGSDRPHSNLGDKSDTVPIEPQKPPENNNAGVVHDEGTRKQSESGTQTPFLVDKVPVRSEPQNLPSVKEAAAVLLDGASEKQLELNKDYEKQPQNGMTLTEPENLPFVKNTILWKTIESMEVFQRLPQKPHFQPLEQFKESSREGLAIGYMVTFSSAIERASKLQLNDPVSIMDDIKETLADLEKHGFHVRHILDCINEMINVKDKRGDLVKHEQTLNSEISERCNVKSRKQREIDEINEHIMKLQRKLAEVESLIEREDEEIAFAQVRLRETHDSIETLESDFERLASSTL